MSVKNLFCLGGYRWLAVLRDGSEFPQHDINGIERSVEALKELDVACLHMIPLTDKHAWIRIDLQKGEGLIKKWTRTFQSNAETGEQVELPVIDAVGIVSDRPTNIFVYADGSIQITTATEPL